jgi:thermitase
MKPQRVFLSAGLPKVGFVARGFARASLSVLVTALLAVALLLGSNAVSQAAPKQDFVTGRILVQPRPGLPSAEFDRLLALHGGHAVGRLGNLNIYVVSLPAGASEPAIAHALAQHPHIKFAEVDQLVAPQFVPNDAYYGNEWHLQTMNVPAAWDYSLGTGVTVAILDSGIDATHPDLQGQLVPGWNFYDNNSNTTDVYGHGTLVAGVVAALGNNSIGVAGIAWGGKLMPVRVTDTSGTGTWSGIASGLNWAADHGARVANLSFAVQASSSTQTAAQYFKNKGGVVVNSAGNYSTLDSTAASDTLLSVSATDSADTRASWASYGPYVDVSAPGVGIWTTAAGGGYSAVSGTSFSSPATAAVVALMMAANPQLSPTQLVNLLESTAVDLGTTGYDYYYGFGRVNAGAAVLAAAQGVAPDVQPPAVAISSPTGGTVSGIVPVNVTASDNVGVTRVDLLVNGTLLASDTTTPYGFSWDTTSLAGSSASLIARAYDAAGNSANSHAVTVTVSSSGSSDTTPPAVAISSPTGGTVSGTVSVSVNASDNVGVTRVDLQVNGVLLASDTASPYTFSWDTAALAGSSATLVAAAYDAAGNSATSKAVSVTVSSGAGPSGPDTTPPIVTIKNPSNGNKVNGMVTISASATDNVAVSSLSLYLDGTMVSTGNSSPVSYKWAAQRAASGTHTITAVATDTSGNQATTTIRVTK